MFTKSWTANKAEDKIGSSLQVEQEIPIYTLLEKTLAKGARSTPEI